MADHEMVFTVSKMKCGGCVANAEQAIRGLPGVEAVKVDLAAKSVVVRGNADPQVVIDALTRIGYPARIKT